MFTNCSIAYSCDETAGDDGHSPTDGKVNATQFPPGVPQPPVLRLPAEFECPICFKVKTFSKPSDWTKHVHEDVQPFTCTFEDCREPKSFKRKADWVRHENERHRHLEWWTCTIPDCSHTCYRKDNFVQHLVREHKMAEPKLKAQKAAKRAKKETLDGGPSEGTPSQEDFDEVWKLVNSCHQTTINLPSQEKCRFCGSACQSWKKLTVHLARHMEQISLPVLDLIKDDSVIPPSRPSAATRRAQQSNPQPKPEPSRPPPPPPIHQPVTEMELDPLDPEQTQLPIDGGYGVLAPPQFQTPEASVFSASPAQVRYTPHNSPNVDQFVIQTSPPQFAGAHLPSPGQQSLGIQQQHPSIQLQNDGRFEYPDQTSRDVYSLSPHTPTRSGITTPQGIPAQAGGLVNVSPPPPTSIQYPSHCNPLIQQFHGEHQILHQPQYFAYGHASGQIQGAHGQVHSQTVAHANSYGFYPQQIAHSDHGTSVNTVPAMEAEEYLGMGYRIT